MFWHFIQFAWNIIAFFLKKKKKNVTNFLSTELARRVVEVKATESSLFQITSYQLTTFSIIYLTDMSIAMATDKLY